MVEEVLEVLVRESRGGADDTVEVTLHQVRLSGNLEVGRVGRHSDNVLDRGDFLVVQQEHHQRVSRYYLKRQQYLHCTTCQVAARTECIGVIGSPKVSWLLNRRSGSTGCSPEVSPDG